MGGKTKQSQRTKNNVRPSSSWRSAELLTNSAGLSSLLSQSCSSEATLFTSLAETSIQSLSNDYILCVKKLQKKDPISKTKGLQELTELIQNSSSEEATEFLTHWARLYPTLSTDLNHKLREAAQICHSAVCVSSGRGLARWLRPLSGPWVLAQFDTHPAAASAARGALSKTFPDKKFQEFLNYCYKDIISHIIDNLLENNEKTIQRQDESPESAAQRYAALCQASLQGLAWLCDVTVLAWPSLAPLVGHTRYWKCQHPLVRSAWLKVTSTLIRKYPEFCEELGQRCARHLLAGPHWDCLLLLLRHTQGNSIWEEKRKELKNRLMELAENGGAGSSPMLVPALSPLPASLRGPQFYTEYFTHMLNGLDKKCVLTSKTERLLRLTSLADCLKYITSHHIEEYKPEFVTNLHRIWLEKILGRTYNGTIRKDLIKVSAISYSTLIKYWSKLGHDQLVRQIWQNIGSTVSADIDRLGTSAPGLSECIEGHVDLLLSINAKVKSKKKKSIKFSDENVKFDNSTVNEEQVSGGDFGKPGDITAQWADADISHSNETREERSEESSGGNEIEEGDPKITEQFRHNLLALVEIVCAKYMDLIDEGKASGPAVAHLLELVREFDSRELFSGIGARRGADLAGLVAGLRARLGLAGAEEGLVELLFAGLRHLEPERREDLFRSFDELPAPACEWVLAACVRVCVRECDSASCAAWLRSGAAAAVLRGATRGRRTQLVRTACTLGRDGELLIGEEAVSGVLAELCDVLDSELGPDSAERDPDPAERDLDPAERDPYLAERDPDPAERDPDLAERDPDPAEHGPDPAEHGPDLAVLGLASHLLSSLPSSSPHYVDLIVKTFQINLYKQPGHSDSSLPPDTWWELATSRQGALAGVAGGVQRCAEVAARLRRGADTLSAEFVRRTEHVATVCALLPPSPGGLAAVLGVPPAGYRSREVAARLGALTLGLQVCAPPAQPAPAALADVQEYAEHWIFTALFLNKVLLGPARGIADGSPAVSSWLDRALEEESGLRALLDLLHELQVGETLLKAEVYLCVTSYELLELTHSIVKSAVGELLAALSPSARGGLLRELRGRARARGHHWALLWGRLSGGDLAGGDLAVEEDLTGDGYFHMLQAKEDSCPWDQLLVRSFSLAHPDLFLPMLSLTHRPSPNAPAPPCASVLDLIVHLYYKHNDVMLYDSDLSAVPWLAALGPSSVCAALSRRVARTGPRLSAALLDFTNISLCELTASLAKSDRTQHVVMLAHSVLQLFLVVESFVSGLGGGGEAGAAEGHVAELPREWAEVFLPTITDNIINLTLQVIEGCGEGASLPESVLLGGLQAALSRLEWPRARPPRPALRLCVALLSRPASRQHHCLAYSLLGLLRPALLREDGLLVGAGEGEPSPADCFLGECAPEETGPALGALLLGAALLETSRGARGDLALLYIRAYLESRLVARLAERALALLAAWGRADWSAELQGYFSAAPPLSASEPPRAHETRRLACRCVYLCAASRAAAGAGPLLEGLAARFVSPEESRRDLAAAARLAGPGLAVQPLPSSRELRARLQAEELPAELLLELHPAHPLYPPRAVLSRSPAPSAAAVYLAHQRDSVAGVVSWWADRVRRWVEKAPVCCVCYCRLQSGRPPGVQCRTCKHKFHPPCLQKWFNTSKDPKCPLCRSPFQSHHMYSSRP